MEALASLGPDLENILQAPNILGIPLPLTGMVAAGSWRRHQGCFPFTGLSRMFFPSSPFLPSLPWHWFIQHFHWLLYSALSMCGHDMGTKVQTQAPWEAYSDTVVWQHAMKLFSTDKQTSPAFWHFIFEIHTHLAFRPCQEADNFQLPEIWVEKAAFKQGVVWCASFPHIRKYSRRIESIHES